MASPPRPGGRKGAGRPPGAKAVRPGPKQTSNQTDLIALPKRKHGAEVPSVAEPEPRAEPKPDKPPPSMASRSISKGQPAPALQAREAEQDQGPHTFRVDRAPVAGSAGGGVGGGAVAVLAIVGLLMFTGMGIVVALIALLVLAPDLVFGPQEPVAGLETNGNGPTLINDGGEAGNPDIQDDRVKYQPRPTGPKTPSTPAEPAGPVLANATVKMSPGSTFRVNQVYIECKSAGVSLKERMGANQSVTLSNVPTGESCDLSLAGPLGRVKGRIKGGQTLTCAPQGTMANCN